MANRTPIGEREFRLQTCFAQSGLTVCKSLLSAVTDALPKKENAKMKPIGKAAQDASPSAATVRRFQSLYSRGPSAQGHSPDPCTV